jgi:hypothetical protein
MIVPRSDNDDDDDDDADDADNERKGNGRDDFMIPISFQSDMTHIHTKAGFTAGGD